MRSSVEQVSGPRARPTSGSWFAVVSLVLVGALFVGNNLAPYLWLPHSGPMIMYSGLSPRADNHFFMPMLPVGESGVYVTVLEAGGPTLDTPPGRTLRAVGDYAQRRGFSLSMNLVRYHANRACAASAQPQLRLSLRRLDRQRVEYANICAEPAALRYVLLPGYPDCDRCDFFRELHRRGSVRR